MIYQIVWFNWVSLGYYNGCRSPIAHTHCEAWARGRERHRERKREGEMRNMSICCDLAWSMRRGHTHTHTLKHAHTHLAQWELIDAFSAGVLTKPATERSGQAEGQHLEGTLRQTAGKAQLVHALWALGSLVSWLGGPRPADTLDILSLPCKLSCAQRGRGLWVRQRGGRGVPWCTAGRRRRLCKYFLILFVAHKRSKANVQASRPGEWTRERARGNGPGERCRRLCRDRSRGRGRGWAYCFNTLAAQCNK